MFDILIIVSGLLLLIYYLFTRKFGYWKRKNIPYPKPVPFFGNYADMILVKKTFGEVVKEICDQFPDAPVVGAFMGTEPVLIPKDPEIIKAILAKDFYYFNGREISDHADKEELMYNLFSTSGDNWKVLRQNLTPLFSSAKMKLMFNMIARCSRSFEQLLEEESKLVSVETKNLMERFTIQCIGACVFGVETDTISHDSDNPFKQAGDDLSKTSKWLAFKNSVRIMWPSLFYRLGFSLLTNELDVFKSIVIAVFKQRDYRPSSRHDFVDLILTWKENSYIEGDKLRSARSVEGGKTSINVTDDLLISQCMIFFSAGFETSAATLSFTLYELAKNERVTKKVCEEVDAYIKRHENKINYDCLSELHYLEACIEETLRKYPVLGATTREVMDNYTFQSGLKVEKDLRVHIPILYLQHNPDFFPEPQEYRPERFYGEEKRNIIPYTYMPFGEGPRICIGMRFAKMQIMAGLVTVLKSYTVELADGMAKELTYRPEAFVTTSMDGINLKFIKREGWEERMYVEQIV
ncbi:cytochrome P450 6B5 [Manduca sexta]|uniref:unspecific monooxygenase n=1 Tax=Manduca sexta TaxID=7130 RepID=A0A921Z5T1_MANSE|nr:cytochrome P450 6B5 [Manduca sexta]KAG6451906.1 hypothetical protein O3G_MSEX007376 [Manduca sexta]KAG6451907.1 hypothetical protein O3G_MSEX007376 [Manduca sexta]